MVRFLLICLGGALGTGARYLLSVWAFQLLGPSFPHGTLWVNVLGSFLLGALMQLGLTTELMSPNVRLALTTGAMGGFTTYSTFSWETLRLLQHGAWGLAALNVGLTLLACLAAAFLGLALVRWWLGS